MKQVIGVSLGARQQDFEFRTKLLGQTLRVRRIGTDGDLAEAHRLLRHWDTRAAAIGLGLAQEAGNLADGGQDARLAAKLRAKPEHAPFSTGERLADIFLERALRHAQATLGHYFDNARVLFFSGLAHRKLALAMAEYTPNMHFADPVLQLGSPKLLTSLDALDLYASGMHYVSDWVPRRLLGGPLLAQWAQHVLKRAVRHASVVVAPVHALDALGLEELAGKTVLTNTVNDARLAALRDKGVQLVIDGAPVLHGHAIDPSLLDAMLLAASGRRGGELLDDDYLEILGEAGMQPRLLYPGGFKRVNRFAFVIHPLSQEYFKKIKPVEVLSRLSPPLLMDSLEKVMAFAPPFVYSRIEGIRSPAGVEAEGWLIAVGGTPKEIMAHSPEFTYRRLLAAAEMARRLGAQIMGLGAFTKVVGDAGVTVARQAPLPITTGNSYSASAALWAARDALLRLRLLPKPRGKERLPFKAMVVGATGAIGAACARLLVRAAEEVVLVSPETAKLLALKTAIERESPGAKVVLAASTERDLPQMDMVVTATSGAGKKVLDIMQVKPGCVITDVARPLDLPPSEVAKRPDVLVIESGEIRLPGEVQMKNIGLPRGVAYACLAETIVLALEGRFENFTVGRQIEWDKVREIYKLGLKHGMQLAAISGVHGEFSDADIARVRKLALAARARASGKAAPERGAVASKRHSKGSAKPAASAGRKRAPVARRKALVV